MDDKIFTGRVFLVVTGASRGIGKAIVETFASHLEKDSHVLLLARNKTNLQQLADSLPKTINASYESIDFSGTSADELEGALCAGLRSESPEKFNQAIIVHCVADMDCTRLTTDLPDFPDWQKSFNLNVFSSAVLNSVFVKKFSSSSTKKFVVNVNSYCSTSPEAYVGPYCAAKAAQAMIFKVFALENPEVNVLSYLPGVVGTDMFFACLKYNNNKELKARIQAEIDNKTFITPTQTAECLVEVLRKQNYKSGDEVDYKKVNQ